MPREYKLYLNDIRTSIEKIEQFVQGLDLEKFRTNTLVVDATLHNFAIMGEAAKNVPDEVRAKYPEVPWRGVTSFRNLLTHEYFRVDLDETWSIIQNYLPELKVQIVNVLAQENDSGSA